MKEETSGRETIATFPQREVPKFKLPLSILCSITYNVQSLLHQV